MRDMLGILEVLEAKSIFGEQGRTMSYPASPPPLSNQDTYTSWPGGVDPTARVYDSVGGKRRAMFAVKSPKRGGVRRRKTPRRRLTKRAHRKAHRKANRKTRRH
jgi:hypothetical protein